MRKNILILFILSTSLMAQIGGITGGKLNAPDAAILPSQAFEFEPSYTMGEAGSFGYRMTAGFGRYEVGVSLDNQAVMGLAVFILIIIHQKKENLLIMGLCMR